MIVNMLMQTPVNNDSQLVNQVNGNQSSSSSSGKDGNSFQNIIEENTANVISENGNKQAEDKSKALEDNGQAEKPAVDFSEENAAIVANIVANLIDPATNNPETFALQTTAEADPTVDVLESNLSDKDIKQPLNHAKNNQPAAKGVDLSAALANILGDDKALARMPQSITTGPVDVSPEQGVKAQPTDLPLEAPRPLENFNEMEKPAAREQANLVPFPETKEAQETNSLARVLPTAQTVDISPERVIYDQQLAATEKPAPVSTSNLFETMIEKIAMSNADGETQMQIQLKPEHLGKVSILLSQANGELTAKIQAEDLGVKNSINAQINALVESLNDKGVKISGVEVVYTGVSADNFDKPHSQQPNEDRASKNNRGQISFEDAELDAVAEMPAWGVSHLVENDENSSVEYRA